MFCKVVILLGQFIRLNTYRVESARSGTFNLEAIVDGSLDILLIRSAIFISDLMALYYLAGQLGNSIIDYSNF